ncbi:DUF1580 domain-containing protein [Planctomicrobium sp. SH661]|uniref:DUF1580 domain-containing protein n=1 Tax=Planctomicrobium sp. SH661 TaxID=3448124 RepID=UPI003F5B4C9B
MSTALPDILQNDLQPVATIAKQITGHRPSPPTVTRWIRLGVGGGIKLPAIYHCGKWMTTPEAFTQFLTQQTAARMATSETADDATDADLIAAGLL